jgi:hypothetical protein
VAKKGRKGSKRKSYAGYDWTSLEKALAVIVVALAITAVYAFMTNDEIVEVGSIETYDGRTVLKTGDEANSTYRFVRELKEDYQVHIKYDVPYAGMVLQPLVHFKVWNETTGKVLIEDTMVSHYNKNIRLDREDTGTYEFVWWVEGDGGSSQVNYNVLIQPTEKLFEKRT